MSLVLCLATAAMWVRSYLMFDRWASGSAQTSGRYWNVESWRGGLSVEYIPAGGLERDRSWYRSYHGRHWGGFEFGEKIVHLRQNSLHAPSPEQMISGPAPPGYFAGVPYWFVVALSSVLPAARLRRVFAWHPAEGLCPACGYDLRATPERCPECGALARRSLPQQTAK